MLLRIGVHQRKSLLSLSVWFSLDGRMKVVVFIRLLRLFLRLQLSPTCPPSSQCECDEKDRQDQREDDDAAEQQIVTTGDEARRKSLFGWTLQSTVSYEITAHPTHPRVLAHVAPFDAREQPVIEVFNESLVEVELRRCPLCHGRRFS